MHQFPLPSQNRKPATFRPPIMRLQSPFNRQGAQLKKTLFLSDLLHRQITRQFLGDFLFSFVTNINLQTIKHSIAMNALSLIFFLLLLFFGTFFDWKHNENKFNEVPKALKTAFHPMITDTPGSVFLTAPFYIQFIITICCFLSYISMFQFYVHRYLGSAGNLFFQYLCSCLVFPFCLFTLTNTLYSLILVFTSSQAHRFLFLINPILALFSLPSLVVSLHCSYSDIRISLLPFANTNPKKTEIWYFLGCTYSLFQTLFVHLDMNDNTSNYWMCALLVLISFLMSFITFHNPIFIHLFTKIMSSAVSLILLVVSLLSFVQCFNDSIYIPTISFALSCAAAIFAILFHSIKHALVNKKMKENEKIEITEISDYYDYYFYCSEENIKKLATKELFDTFEEKNPTDFSLQIIILRYLNHENNSAAVFEKSVNLLKILAGQFYYSLQLTGLIEKSSDIVGNSATATNIRQQQLDSILEQCISSQLEFWRAILLENPNKIGECAIRLYQDVQNARVFFKQLSVNENSKDQYGIKYVDYLMNIAVDLVTLEHVDVDATRPVPYDQRFAMHQPRRDTKSKIETPQVALAPFALKVEANLEVFPSLIPEEQKKALISQDRIDLCKSACKKRLAGENVRMISFILFYSLLAVLSLSLVIIIIVMYSSYTSKLNEVQSVHESLYAVFNCTVALLNYKTSPYYPHNYPVPNSYVEMCLQTSLNVIHSDSNVMNFLNASFINDTFNEMKSFFLLETKSAQELVTSEVFYDLATKLTIMAQKYLTHLQTTIDCFSKATNDFHSLITKLHSVSSFTFIILLPFFIGIFTSFVLSLRKLFWQPILIDKAEAANVFQAFLHISSPERRRSHIRSEQFNRNRNKSRLSFSRYGWLLGSIAMFFFLQFLIIELFLLIFDNEITNFAGLSFSFGNCSTIMTHITTNLYRFIPLGFDMDAYRFFNWFLSTLDVFQATVTSFDTSSLDFDIQLYENQQIPVVNQTLGSLDSLSMFPLKNSSANQAFYHAVISTFMVMSETLTVHETSFTVARIKDVIYYEGTADYFFNYTFAEYQDTINIYRFLAAFVIVLFIVLELVILLFSIFKQTDVRHMINLVIRTIVLLPDKTPLVKPEKTEINFISKMPKSPTQKMLDSLPVGFVVCDKNGTITHANPKASEFFGQEIIGCKAADLKPQDMRFYSVSSYPMSQFPRHPFDTKLPKGTYTVYNDITELNLNKLEHDNLQNELKEMRRHRLPSSVTVTRKGQKQNVIMMDNFAMVEAAFPKGMTQEVFMKLKHTLESKIEPIPTVFLSEFFRDSVVIVFSSFNVQSHQRQFLRDALRCAQLVSECCKKEMGAKVAVTNGRKCICKITDHELARVAFYAPLMTKAAMMMRFGINGDIVVEWNIMKIISGFEANFEKVGTGAICNKDVDFCLINNDDNLLKTFFGTVSTTNIVFS